MSLSQINQATKYSSREADCSGPSFAFMGMEIDRLDEEDHLWEEVLHLRQLVRQNTPAHVIARKLGRSIDAVYVKASREGISLRLMPTSYSIRAVHTKE